MTLSCYIMCERPNCNRTMLWRLILIIRTILQVLFDIITRMVTDSINILYDMSEVVTSANSPTTFPPPTYCTSQFSNAIGSSADRQLSGPSDVIIQPEQVKPSSIETDVSIPSIVKRSIPDMSRTVYDNELEDGPTIHAQRLHNLDVQQTPLINEFQCLRINSVKEIFCCMLRNLFKEYNVFPAYSERELILTAHLFICVKECGLISNDKDLRYAICCVLDALKKNPNLKIYDFGIATLDQFRNHQFRTHICKIPHFQQFQPHLIELLNANTTNIYCTLMVKESRKKAIEKHEKVVIPAENVQNNIANRTQIDDTLLVKYSRKKEIEKVNEIILLTKNVKDKLLNTTHIDNNLLVKVNRKNKKRVIEKYDKIVVPDGNVQNKIAFIFNNLSELSLQTKCNEIKNIITEEFLPWFSNYLVMKRVTNEFNFHTLYFNCLDCLKNEALNSLIISETVKNIKVSKNI
ncbi:Hypothetical protein CINCED_3A013443 [Cinara cedri]|uniref:Uncharacterized protein n=1 Tax=Cinara cedri TaxID=506608 RepID=A0A5E4M3F3_9HEMI|nr:Hypothetical protein CINCED_3A013443 [Cinara cedri]